MNGIRRLGISLVVAFGFAFSIEAAFVPTTYTTVFTDGTAYQKSGPINTAGTTTGGIQEALNAAGIGGGVVLAPGLHDIGTGTIWPTNNQTIIANGALIAGNASIASGTASYNIPMMLKPANGMVWVGGTFSNNPTSAQFSCYVGNRYSDTIAQTNWLIRDARFIGADTDGFYFGLTNQIQSGSIRNCYVETKWDTFVLKGTYTNRQFLIDGCVLVATNLSSIGGSDHKGVNSEGGYVTIKNSLIYLTNGAIANTGLKVTGDNDESSKGFIKAYNVGFQVSGTLPNELENDADYLDAGVSDPTNIVAVGCYRLLGGALRLTYPGADGSAGATIWQPIYGNAVLGALSVSALTASLPVYTDASKNLVSGTAPVTSYASGTAYTLTATPAQLTFGTTSPGVTLATAGTYLITGTAGVKYAAATYAGAQTITLKLRRTNNTAADLTSGSRAVELPVLTTFTGGDVMSTPSVVYAATAGDIVQLFGSVSATPSAGSVQTDSAEIIAVRLF